MKKGLFILFNCTQHTLTEEQKVGYDEFRSLRDENPELFKRLGSSPEEEPEIRRVALDLHQWINEKIQEFEDIDTADVTVDFLFPIGSPAVMATFFYIDGMIAAEGVVFYKENVRTFRQVTPWIVFSHSERVVEEIGEGQKKVTFVHKKFIRFPY